MSKLVTIFNNYDSENYEEIARENIFTIEWENGSINDNLEV